MSLVAVPATVLTTSAHASDAKVSHQHSSATTTHRVAPSTTDKSKATASRGSVVFSVPSSFVAKKKAACKRHFRHNIRLRLLCLGAQGPLASAARYKVNNWRANQAIHTWKLNERLAKWCRHHHKRCAHSKRLRGLTIRTCGPLAGPTWKFRATCLRNRAGTALNKFLLLKVFTTSTLSPKAVRKLKKAVKAMGPKDNTRVSVTHGLSFWKGPYMDVVIKRSQTEQVYKKTRDTTDIALIGTLICTIIGSETAGLVSVVCTTALGIALHDIKTQAGKAHDAGKCLAVRFYALSSFAVIGITPPLGVSNCVASKASVRRTLNRAELRQMA